MNSRSRRLVFEFRRDLEIREEDHEIGGVDEERFRDVRDEVGNGIGLNSDRSEVVERAPSTEDKGVCGDEALALKLT